ncbi:unnamed protein product [Calicophoron daubneyi]|uniref:Reticulocalbin-3 n=1 Tax=Calicophoron daubneyi TaxID=300641 RepID=A0AAV2T3C9_CALDB
MRVAWTPRSPLGYKPTDRFYQSEPAVLHLRIELNLSGEGHTHATNGHTATQAASESGVKILGHIMPVGLRSPVIATAGEVRVSVPMMRIFLVFALICLVPFIQATPHREAKSRDETAHFADDPERHNVDFDHEAFLGSETVQEFSRLTPEQSREKLREIVKRIDTDGDGKITEAEMKQWVIYVYKTSTQKSTDKHWAAINTDNKPVITWKEYSETTYGPEQERLNDPESVEDYKRAIKHDRRRWDAADLDRDGSLTKEELADFLNPEDKKHMREALIDELLDAVDTDKDGYVSEKEYIDDLARAYQTTLEPGQPEPEWVKSELSQFKDYRDADKDGRLNREEVGEWIMPANYDPHEAETQHLFYHADADHDKVLTEQEILDKQDLFVNSRATNYGTVFEQREEL